MDSRGRHFSCTCHAMKTTSAKSASLTAARPTHTVHSLSVLVHMPVATLRSLVLHAVVQVTLAQETWSIGHSELNRCHTFQNITFSGANRIILSAPLNHTHTHLFNGPLSGTTQVSLYQKGETNLDFTKARDSGSGISWAICKSAPCSRQITKPAPHHSLFTGWMPFLPPNQTAPKH